MANRSPLEWEVVLDDADWARDESLTELTQQTETVTPDASPACTKRTQLRRQVWVALCGLIMLSVTVMGTVLWHRSEETYEQVEAEINESIALEERAADMREAFVMSSLLDEQASQSWQEWQAARAQRDAVLDIRTQRTVQDVVLEGDLAMVSIHETLPDLAPSVTYRQTHFYRYDDGVWLRTEPQLAFWGAQETLATDHFVFTYRRLDRVVVAAVAAHLDSIYREIRQDMALVQPSTESTEKITIDIGMQNSMNHYRLPAQGRMRVLSPVLLPIPDTFSNTDILLAQIVYELSRSTRQETLLEGDRMSPHWYIVLMGLQLWQTYGSSSQLPPYHEEAFTWLHRELLSEREDEASAEVTLRLLCRSTGLWMEQYFPFRICMDASWWEQMRDTDSLPDKLHQITKQTPPLSVPIQQDWTFDKRIAATTLIEYFVSTYGREQLPVLVEKMRLYDTWQDLIPAVVGVSAEEFEAGWQDYVQASYGQCETDCAIQDMAKQP